MDVTRFELGDALLDRARATSTADFEVSREASGLFALTVFGPLPAGWCGHLFAQCAGSGLSVLEGRARRASAGRWAGVFRLELLEGGASPRGLDFVRFCQRSPQRWARPDSARIDRVRVDADDPDGARVEVEGRDQLGLLAWLIESFAFFGLYPMQLSVSTEGRRIHDVFWLTGVGGTPASEAGLEGLRALLEGGGGG